MGFNTSNISFPEDYTFHEEVSLEQIEPKKAVVETVPSEEQINLKHIEKLEKKATHKKKLEDKQIDLFAKVGTRTIEQLEEAHKSEKKPATRLKQDHQELQNSAANIAKNSIHFKKRMDQTMNELQQLNKKGEALSQQIKDLKQDLPTGEGKADELVDTIQSLNQGDRRTRNEAGRVLRDHEAYVEAIHRADNEFNSIKSILTQLTQDATEIEKTFDSHLVPHFKAIGDAVAQIKGVVDESQHIPENLEKIEDQVKRIRKHLDFSGAQGIVVQDKVGKLVAAFEILEKKLSDAGIDVKKANEAIKKTDRDLYFFREEVDKSPSLDRHEARKMDKQLSKEHTKIKKTKTNVKKAEEEIKEIKGKVEETHKIVDKLDSEAAQLNQAVTQLEKEFDKIVEEFKSEEEKIEIGEHVEAGSKVSDISYTFSDAGSGSLARLGPTAAFFESAAFFMTMPKLGMKAKLHHNRQKIIENLSQQLTATQQNIHNLSKNYSESELKGEDSDVLYFKLRDFFDRFRALKEKLKELKEQQNDLTKEIAEDAASNALMGMQAGASITKAAVTITTTVEMGTSAGNVLFASGAVGSVGGLLSVALASKDLDENRRTANELNAAYEAVMGQLKVAEEGGDEMLQTILKLRLESIKQQITDNSVSTTKNVMCLFAGIYGTSSGALGIGAIAVAGTAATVLAATSMATGVGGAVIAGIGLAIGGSYLIYKKRHAIRHFYQSSVIKVKKKWYTHEGKRIDGKIETIKEKIIETREKIKSKHTLNAKEAEKNKLHTKLGHLKEQKGNLTTEKHKVDKILKQLDINKQEVDREYKYKRDIASLGGKITEQDLKTMEDKVNSKEKLDSLVQMLEEEQRKGNIHEDPNFLLEPNRDKERTYQIIMEYIKAPIHK